MNQAFIIKMIKAKKMEYEAIKELMPKPARAACEEMEKEAGEFVKSILMEYIKEEKTAAEKEKGKSQGAKKVDVEF